MNHTINHAKGTQMKQPTQLHIEMIDGSIAPRYTQNVKRLEVTKAVVTEKGTASNLPLVDFQLIDEQGNEYFFMITGRLINMVSAAIKGANMRNHGIDEP